MKSDSTLSESLRLTLEELGSEYQGVNALVELFGVPADIIEAPMGEYRRPTFLE